MGLTKIFLSVIFNRHSIEPYRISHTWGFSSVGRAPALHAGGHRFDPDKLHHLYIEELLSSSFFIVRYSFQCHNKGISGGMFRMLCIVYTPCIV